MSAAVPDRKRLRASDVDRQAAAERLRAGLDEGRLDFGEYDARLARAYGAVTYGDLDELFTDLPAHSSAVRPASALAGDRSSTPVAARPGAVPDRRRVPTPLRVLWTVWASIVAVNLTVWLLVSIGNGEPDYFWPMWLLVPAAGLLAVTGSVQAGRRMGPPTQRED